jgi:hypothetical protein
MPRNFRELEAKMSPEARARAQALAEKYRAEMALDECRDAVTPAPSPAKPTLSPAKTPTR